MAREYFNQLNYSVGNEDTALELEVMPGNPRHVFAVAGSGSRIIPLFAKNPGRLTCVDSSPDQLSFAELRIASFRFLEREEFMGFWGYPPVTMAAKERKAVFDRLSLSARALEFAVRSFKKNGGKTLLYNGKWEQTFKKLSFINRMIVGKKGLGIFDCKTMEEQGDYLRGRFPQKKWDFSVSLLGNAALFNALLYRGNFPKKNIPQTAVSFYKDSFSRLFSRDVARKNYFLQLLFFGKLVYPEGSPAECDPAVFSRAKEGIAGSRVDFVLGDSIEAIRHASAKIDFLSLSDVPSYLKPPREQNFLQEIKSNMSDGGIVASRYYLRVPENLDTRGYEDITDNYSEAIGQEKVQVYSFGIYRKK